MEVKIGVQSTQRELVLDTTHTAEEVEKLVVAAMAGKDGVLALNDTKGRRVLVPTDKLAYVECGTPSVGQVGFRS